MSNDNAAGAVETLTVESLQASLAKAEAKIVEMKQKSTEPKNEGETVETKEPATFTEDTVAKMIKEAMNGMAKENAIASQEEAFDNNQNITNSMAIGNEPAVSQHGFQTKSFAEY
jgi:hypothetical protein